MKLYILYYLALGLLVTAVGSHTLFKNAQSVAYGTQAATLQRQLYALQQSKTATERSLAQTSTLEVVNSRALLSGFEPATAPIAVLTHSTVATLQ